MLLRVASPKKAAMQIGSSAHEPTLADAWAAAASVLLGHIKYRTKRMFSPTVQGSATIAAALRGLHRDGYFVMPGYLDANSCAQARNDIDRVIIEQPDALQRFGENSDLRIYGSENASTVARRFHEDAFCLDVGRAYRRGHLVDFSTLAARLTARPGNLGSGQGWHRDAFHFQFKAMIYLSDVGMDNGPFQILPCSHHGYNVVRDTLVGRLDRPPASRISDIQIARLLDRKPSRACALPGAAGTLIFFNSSAIHRGMPIQSGTRYALTNYYYPPQAVTPEMYRQFAPFARG